MAEENTGKGISKAGSAVAKEVQHAKKTASKIAKIAKQSKGNWYAAAAATAKEAVKDPEWAAKTILHVTIFSIVPLLLVICLMFNFGGAIIAYVENIIRGAMEDAALNTGGSLEGWALHSEWNIFKEFLSGDTTKTTKAVVDKIAAEYSDEFFEGHKDEKGNDLGDGVNGQILDNEYQMAITEEAAEAVFRDRLNMVRKSAESRYDQYMDEANAISQVLLIWGNSQLTQELSENASTYITTTNYEMLDPQIELPDNGVSDADCAAVIALFSAQYNIDLQNVQIMDFRYWLGMYSKLKAIFVKEEITPSESPITDIDTLPVTIGNSTTQIVPANLEGLSNASLNVARWHGTFVPQYVLEQYKQDKAADEILAEDSTASQEQKDAALASLMGTSGASYPDSVGLIDEFMAYTGISCELVITADTENDISYVKPIINIGVRTKTPEELGTDVAGLWSGALDTENDSGINRTFHNLSHPNLLKHTWTDSRGATYQRQEGYQYEYYLDMIDGFIQQYHLSGNNGEGAGLGDDYIPGAGDGTDIVAEANRIYKYYHDQPSSVQRNYVWSEYYHRPYQSSEAWCCAFVYVCADHCGYIGQDNVFGPDMYSWCKSSSDWFEAKGRVSRSKSYIPKPGDIIYFYNEGVPNRIKHVGIVEYYDEATGKVHTIEGNCRDKLAKLTYNAAPDSFCYWTEDADGNSVRRLIWGYASPNYPTKDNTPAPPVPTPTEEE